MWAAISFVFGDFGGNGGNGGSSAGMAVARTVAAATAPLLLVVALVLLYGPALRLGRAATWLVVVAGGVSVVSASLFGPSFGVGMDDADAGRPTSLFGSLTLLFLIVAPLAGVVALTVVVFHGLAHTTLRRPIAAAFSLVGAGIATPAVLVCLFMPQGSVLAAVTVLVLLALGGPRTPARTDPAPAPPPAPLLHRVRVLALASLSFSVAVWGGGLAASIAGAGTEVATSALGYASATAQLAAVPLIIAVTLLVAARVGAGPVPVGAAVAIVVTVTASACMVAVYDPAGDGYILLAGVIALGVAAWLATVLWQFGADRDRGDRMILSAAGGLGGAMLYASLCVLSGGLGLLLVSSLLLFCGRMLVQGTRGRPAISPATLPASS